MTSDTRLSHLSRAMLNTGSGLGMRLVGDHTLCITNAMPCLFINRVFLAGQFEYLMTYLKKLVPDSKQSFLMQFLSHVRRQYSCVHSHINCLIVTHEVCL